MDSRDPVALTQALIRCPSITPADAGAMDVVRSVLLPLGFDCHAVDSETGGPLIRNLYARLGQSGRNFCFAGHTDVVPVNDQWTVDPFAGVVDNGRLYGRGTVDMKGAIACFIAAVARFLDQGQPANSISLLITGDEEGPAIDGTVKVLEWLQAKQERLDLCVVGEPTNPNRLGEMMKIGRRGSLNAVVTVTGTGGHVAYPHLADNPIPRLLAILARLTAQPLDQGSAHFQPSSLVLTSVDVGNKATNVIPAQAEARLNIRFNDLHTGASLRDWITSVVAEGGETCRCKIDISGESFLTEPGELTKAVSDSVAEITGLRPDLSTTGGTSDARFIKSACPVLEFGLVGQTMHKIDEHVAVDDLETLTQIYTRLLQRIVGYR